jgi:hypothetical protein
MSGAITPLRNTSAYLKHRGNFTFTFIRHFSESYYISRLDKYIWNDASFRGNSFNVRCKFAFVKQNANNFIHEWTFNSITWVMKTRDFTYTSMDSQILRWSVLRLKITIFRKLSCPHGDVIAVPELSSVWQKLH